MELKIYPQKTANRCDVPLIRVDRISGQIQINSQAVEALGLTDKNRILLANDQNDVWYFNISTDDPRGGKLRRCSKGKSLRTTHKIVTEHICDTCKAIRNVKLMFAKNAETINDISWHKLMTKSPYEVN